MPGEFGDEALALLFAAEFFPELDAGGLVAHEFFFRAVDGPPVFEFGGSDLGGWAVAFAAVAVVVGVGGFGGCFDGGEKGISRCVRYA